MVTHYLTCNDDGAALGRDLEALGKQGQDHAVGDISQGQGQQEQQQGHHTGGLRLRRQEAPALLLQLGEVGVQVVEGAAGAPAADAAAAPGLHLVGGETRHGGHGHWCWCWRWEGVGWDGPAAPAADCS